MTEEYEVFVPREENLYSYPYVALISGTDEKYGYKRSFLSYEKVENLQSGVLFSFVLPENGIYEQCIKHRDINTREFLRRERAWFILCDGDIFEIQFGEIPEALHDFEGMCKRLAE